MFLVKFLFGYYSFESFFSNLNIDFRTYLGIFASYQSHANTLVCRNGMVSRSNFANLITIEKHVVPMTWNSFVCQLYSDNLLFYSLCFLFCDGLFPYEFTFVKFAKHS